MISRPRKVASTKTYSPISRDEIMGPPWCPSIHGGESDLASVGHEGAPQNFVFQVEGEPSVLPEGKDERRQVARVKRACVPGHFSGEIEGTEDRHTTLNDRLPRTGQRAVASALGGRIHDYRSRLHPVHHLCGEEPWRLHSADQRRRDDNVRRRAPVREKL